MKLLTALLASTVMLAGCNQTPSATDAPPASQQTADDVDIPAAEPEAMAPHAGPASPGKAGVATGTVESIDVANGKITIAHGPVPALEWPAMTMAFTATPEQLQSVEAGQQVEFQFVSQGMKASLVSIQGR